MKYDEMKKLLIIASDAYYNRSESIISDTEFDIMRDDFKKNYPDDPLLKTIGAPVSELSSWEKMSHEIPMVSCNKVNEDTEFDKWIRDNKLKNETLVTSEKLDGCSISLKYVKGKLVNAITRGDGKIGENIYNNVIKMKNVIPNLPVNYSGSLRGEIIMKNGDLAFVNEICKSRGDRGYINVRNAASGICRNFSGKFCEYLTILYYYAEGDFETKESMYDFIIHLGLEVCPHYIGNIDKAKEVYNLYQNELREKLNYAIDGLVIESDNISTTESLGMLGENFRGVIAWKFGAETAKTKVVDVEFQLGNSGRVTPVLVVEPTKISGVTIQRVSVHNLAIFNEFKLHIGDVVIISRANDVIPFLKENLGGGNNKIIVPQKCPKCDGTLTEEPIFLVCNNENCVGAKVGNIIKWIQKTDMLGISDATIQSLYDEGLIRNAADLYKLKPSMINSLDGFGDKSAKKIVEIIQSKKEVSFGVFLGGLNINQFSDKTAELLEKNGYDNIDKILNESIENLCKVKGIGEITASAILVGLKEKLSIIKQLLDVGVKIMTKEKNVGGNLNGKSFCVTGSLEMGKRDDFIKMVEENGGVYKSGIAKDLSYLVTNDTDTGSAKNQKATSLGVAIINEVQFLKMI